MPDLVSVNLALACFAAGRGQLGREVLLTWRFSFGLSAREPKASLKKNCVVAWAPARLRRCNTGSEHDEAINC